MNKKIIAALCFLAATVFILIDHSIYRKAKNMWNSESIIQVLIEENDKLYTIVENSMNAREFPEEVHKASWYGPGFHGKISKSGEVFDQNKMTCASTCYPMNTLLEVINSENGKSVFVRVTDTGGFEQYGRKLDLSKAAFQKIENLEKGIVKIKIRVLCQS